MADSPRGPGPRPADYCAPGPDGVVQCTLCHHRCTVRPGGVGICRVRRNDGGTMVLPFYGQASALSVDPMEKKPLYHFMPGTSTFSIGYVGCNLHCPFCQNFGISQSTGAAAEAVTPPGIVEAARRTGCPSVSHTYSEPIVHAEFVEEAMRACRAAGLASILVTNGCAGPEAASSLLSLCDAVNVDIKAWDETFYRNELGGDLSTVIAFIETAVRNGVHVEATTLVIPGKNDDERQIDGIAGFLAALSADIPLHLSAYRPMYRYTVPATPTATLRRLSAAARRRLRYVYAGNVVGETATTLCPSCGSVLVERRGYIADVAGLSEDGSCASCGGATPIKGVRRIGNRRRGRL